MNLDRTEKVFSILAAIVALVGGGVAVWLWLHPAPPAVVSPAPAVAAPPSSPPQASRPAAPAEDPARREAVARMSRAVGALCQDSDALSGLEDRLSGDEMSRRLTSLWEQGHPAVDAWLRPAAKVTPAELAERSAVTDPAAEADVLAWCAERTGPVRQRIAELTALETAARLAAPADRPLRAVVTPAFRAEIAAGDGLPAGWEGAPVTRGSDGGRPCLLPRVAGVQSVTTPVRALRGDFAVEADVGVPKGATLDLVFAGGPSPDLTAGVTHGQDGVVARDADKTAWPRPTQEYFTLRVERVRGVLRVSAGGQVIRTRRDPGDGEFTALRVAMSGGERPARLFGLSVAPVRSPAPPAVPSAEVLFRQGFKSNFAGLAPGALPPGWMASPGFVPWTARDEPVLRAMAPPATKTEFVQPPPMAITGDFAIDLDFAATGDQALRLMVLGKDDKDTQRCGVRFFDVATVVYGDKAVKTERSSHPVRENSPFKLRLERAGDEWRLSFDGTRTHAVKGPTGPFVGVRLDFWNAFNDQYRPADLISLKIGPVTAAGRAP